MGYKVYITETFEKEISKLSKKDNELIKKMFFQIKDNPYTGDHLKYKFLREKRIREKRVYFLIYEDLQAVLFVAVGGKKTQQKTIDEIIKFLPYFREYIQKLLMD